MLTHLIWIRHAVDNADVMQSISETAITRDKLCE